MSLWLKSLVSCLLVVSTAMQLLPGEKYEQYVRLFTGFLLIILLLQPILKLGSLDTFLEQRIMAFVQEQEQLEEEIHLQGEMFLQESEQLGEEEMDIWVDSVEEIKIRVEVTADD